MKFEWDPQKVEANRAKHGVTFVEAATVFGDPRAITFFDEQHSDYEKRFLTIGFATSGRLLVVIHTDRSDTIRINSARTAVPRERKVYEQSS